MTVKRSFWRSMVCLLKEEKRKQRVDGQGNLHPQEARQQQRVPRRVAVISGLSYRPWALRSAKSASIKMMNTQTKTKSVFALTPVKLFQPLGMVPGIKYRKDALKTRLGPKRLRR
jgi:hypothetical protein